jgi:hypothetical protein
MAKKWWNQSQYAWLDTLFFHRFHSLIDEISSKVFVMLFFENHVQYVNFLNIVLDNNVQLLIIFFTFICHQPQLIFLFEQIDSNQFVSFIVFLFVDFLQGCREREGVGGWPPPIFGNFVFFWSIFDTNLKKITKKIADPPNIRKLKILVF